MADTQKDDFAQTHRAEKMIIDDFIQNIKTDPMHYLDYRRLFNKEMHQLSNVLAKDGGREDVNQKMDSTSKVGALYQFLDQNGKDKDAKPTEYSSPYYQEITDELIIKTTPRLREKFVDGKNQSERSVEQVLNILETAKKSGNLVQTANQIAHEEMPGVVPNEHHKNVAQSGRFSPKNVTDHDTPNPMDLHLKETQPQKISDLIQQNLKLHLRNNENVEYANPQANDFSPSK